MIKEIESFKKVAMVVASAQKYFNEVNKFLYRGFGTNVVAVNLGNEQILWQLEWQYGWHLNRQYGN